MFYKQPAIHMRIRSREADPFAAVQGINSSVGEAIVSWQVERGIIRAKHISTALAYQPRQAKR